MAALWSRSRQRQDTGDEALIRSLYEEHGRALLAYAQRLTGDRSAAEDVVQETLIRAWKHPDALVNGKGSVRGWLLTVARNIITDRYRAKAARPTEVAESVTTQPVEQDHADAVVDSMVVMEALDRLSRTTGTCLWKSTSRAGALPRRRTDSGYHPGRSSPGHTMR